MGQSSWWGSGAGACLQGQVFKDKLYFMEEILFRFPILFQTNKRNLGLSLN